VIVASLGNPLASGRTADIDPWGDEHGLKLFRDWFSLEKIHYEAQIHHAECSAGFPATKPGEIVQAAGRNGLVYDREEPEIR
jgi:hypothetical protein